jgi:tetratricopeptide (TPR) repeat protein
MHRDLKPSNVMVRPDGSPVLLDFGLAADAQAATLTRTGDILGTPRYIAPELARGEHADARTDVYGLGLILFEMVALRPAQACGGGTRGVTSSVRLLPAPPLRRAARDCPRALDAICNTAIAYRRRRRFPACEDLAEALEAFAAGRRSNLRSPGLVSRWIDHAVARPMHAAGVGLVTLVVALTLALLRDRAPSALDIERTFDRALVAWVDGDAERAGSTLRALLDRSPDHADGRFLEGLIVNRLPAARGDPYLTALAQGRTKDAERASDACVDAYTTARSLEPGSPLPIVLLSLAALDHGYVDLARRHLETATRELPECQALSRALAKTLLATKDYEAASQRFAEAVAQRPDDRELWHDLVRSRYYAGDGDGAMDAIRRALAHLKPEDGDWLLLSQAQILDLNRRHDEARELCSRVLEHTPDHRRALRLVAASWDREHRFQDAEEAYLRVLEHHPRDVHSHYALAHMYAGANRSICAGCARHFDDHPEALKPDCSLHHLEEVHRLLAGREPDVLRETLAIARRAGRGPGLIPVLREVRMRLLAGIEAGKPLGARLDIVTLLLAEIEGG